MNEIEILQQQGYQTIPRLDQVTLTPLFRGRPIMAEAWSKEELDELISLCPTGAITKKPLGLNLAKCVFCKACTFRFPEKITFTNDYRIAANDYESLMVRPATKAIELNADRIRSEIRTLFGRALKLRQVSAGGDNSAEMELNACGNVNFDMGRYGIEFVASPRHADGLVITGPVSRNMLSALEICYHAVPSPKILILAGTEAISGGIFAGNDQVSRDFIQKHPIDLMIPGNPPHPLSIINGILDLIRPDWHSFSVK